MPADSQTTAEAKILNALRTHTNRSSYQIAEMTGCNDVGISQMPQPKHPERGDLDKMTKKPASVQRELAEARRILSQVIVPPAMDSCAWCGGHRTDQVHTSYYTKDKQPLCRRCWEAEYNDGEKDV